MLFCTRLNVETMQGSIAQLGAFDYYYACQLPLVPLILDKN